ncbi:hypothetical protein [Calothrix sp. NIES-2100]
MRSAGVCANTCDTWNNGGKLAMGCEIVKMTVINAVKLSLRSRMAGIYR